MSSLFTFSSPLDNGFATQQWDGTKLNYLITYLERTYGYNYVLFNDAGTIYAYRTSDGSQLGSGTNFGSLLNSVTTDAATNSKSRIFMAPGTYSGSGATINSKSNITIEGVYGQTILKNTSASSVSLAIGAQGATSRVTSNIHLRNLVFDGNYPTNSLGCGVDVNALDGGIFENLIFQNHGTRAFRMTVWTTSQISSRRVTCRNFKFINDCTVVGGVTDCLYDGFHFSGTLPSTMNGVADISFGEQATAALVENTNFDNWWFDDVVNGGAALYVISGLQYIRDVKFRNLHINSTTSKLRGIERTTNPGDAIKDNLVIESSEIYNVSQGINCGFITVKDTHIKGCVNYGFTGGNSKLIRCKIGNTNTGSSGVTTDKGCLYLEGITTDIDVDDCEFYDNATSTTPQGLYLNNTTSLRMRNCRFTGPFTVGPVVTAGTNTGSVIRDSPGQTPAGVIAETVGASPWTFTNTRLYDIALYLRGGTVSNITKNSISIFTATPATISLKPTESVTVTYSSAPTANSDRK